ELPMDWKSLLLGQDADVVKAATADATRPFDLVAGPMLRVSLLQNETSTAIVTTSPVVTLDAQSVVLLLQEVARSYSGEPTDETLQYADYSEWSNGLADNDDAEANSAKAFWEEMGKRSLHYPELPLEFRERKQGSASLTTAVIITEATHQALQTVATKANVG